MSDTNADHSGHGGNCPDSVQRDFYRQALVARIGLEAAQATVRQKSGSYRSILGAAKKAGVNTAALTHALNVRFLDPDDVLRDERDKLKMLDLSGFLPGIREKLLGRGLEVEEATTNEAHETAMIIAVDRGTAAGAKGASRDANPYRAGTEYHVQWTEGWLAGQRAIADEMEVNALEAARNEALSAATPTTEWDEADDMEIPETVE